MAESSGTPVGTAYVSLEARTAQLEAGLADAQARIEQFAASSQTATTKADRGFSTLGKSIRRTIAPITQLIGSVTAAIGAFSLFVNIGERLGRVLAGVNEAGQTAAESAGDAVRAVSEARQAEEIDLRKEPENVKKSREVFRKIKPQLDALDAQEDALLEDIKASRQNDLIFGTIGRPARERRIAANEQKLKDIDRERLSLLRFQATAQRAALAGSGSRPSSITGDSEAIRLLRTIEMHSRRRGADE